MVERLFWGSTDIGTGLRAERNAEVSMTPLEIERGSKDDRKENSSFVSPLLCSTP